MRTEATPERVAKLPMWAREERDGFRRRISKLEAENAALRNEPGALDNSPFDVHAAVFDPYGLKISLGEGHVRYTLPPGDRRQERYIDVHYIGHENRRQHGLPGVELMGSAGMVLRGVASNVFVVEVADD